MTDEQRLIAEKLLDAANQLRRAAGLIQDGAYITAREVIYTGTILVNETGAPLENLITRQRQEQA